MFPYTNVFTDMHTQHMCTHRLTLTYILTAPHSHTNICTQQPYTNTRMQDTFTHIYHTPTAPRAQVSPGTEAWVIRGAAGAEGLRPREVRGRTERPSKAKSGRPHPHSPSSQVFLGMAAP